jgi:hypothetical protein
MKRIILASGLCLAALAGRPAFALTGPDSIEIDAGPLGSANISGGTDGFGYYLTGTGSETACNFDIECQLGDKPVGADDLNYLFSITKTLGTVQYTVEVGATSSLTLGTIPIQATSGYLSPLYEGFVSYVPNANLTVSVGQIPSQEGYESLPDWSNANMLASLLYYTQNTVSRGVLATYNNSAGTINATLEFGDGYRTGVFNYLQFLAGYNFTNGSYVDVYGGVALGRSGLNTIGAYGPESGGYAAEYNSDMIGAYYGGYSYKNLSIVPEVQFQYSKPDAIIGVPKETDNYGALLILDYSFGQTPYSLGGFIEYAGSHGSDNTWFIGPGAAAVGVSVAPTWQRRNLFARLDAGYLYLTNNKSDGASYGYGSNNEGKGQFTGIMEAGVLF